MFGAGMVGSAMAIDLAKDHQVTVADVDQSVLNKVLKKCTSLSTKQLDVTDKTAVQEAIEFFDLVICAVPGFLGFNTLQSIIESGKNVVDISFFPENALELDALAKEHSVTAIVDCGVAPGMGNILLGYYNEKFEISHFECLVGGLPMTKKWPFCYKAPFSPIDVIEEYTRPARYVANGKLIVREALTDRELIQFERVGTLESFNSDGLRTIIDTMPHIPNMKEKTLRYPGHVEYILVLKESGFFDDTPIEVNGNSVSPIAFTSKVLFSEWKLDEDEAEFTVMRISMKGRSSDEKEVAITCDLYDEFDTGTKTSSMARTTGYTATGAANLLLEGLFSEKGVFPPELVGKHEACFNYIMNYLQDRDVRYEINSQNL